MFILHAPLYGSNKTKYENLLYHKGPFLKAIMSEKLLSLARKEMDREGLKNPNAHRVRELT
jgi:hypothetical protein